MMNSEKHFRAASAERQYESGRSFAAVEVLLALRDLSILVRCRAVRARFGTQVIRFDMARVNSLSARGREPGLGHAVRIEDLLQFFLTEHLIFKAYFRYGFAGFQRLLHYFCGA